MSENLIKLFTTQFSTSLTMQLQQKDGKFRGRVNEGSYVGKQASPINEVGTLNFQAPSGRFAPLNRQDPDFVRRWLFPIDRDLPVLIDSFDLLKTACEDPKSAYVMSIAAAANRAYDDEIIRAATADAQVGQDAAGLSTETFDTTKFRVADTFGSSAASGLTVAKMKEAKRILRHYENDLGVEPLTLAAGSQQESDLLNEIEVTSMDFNDRPVMKEGTIDRFLGFDLVWTERLPTYTTNTRGVLAFVKSALHLGIWQDVITDIDRRKDLSGHPWQIYSQISFGASRMEPGKLIQIACLDSTGGPIKG